ncbi:MAG: PSD1 domain-containing protein [Planctomycetaceae bacterium]|nr:PSD1 domain-containing protein [Planctomycetaceae bacterium]
MLFRSSQLLAVLMMFAGPYGLLAEEKAASQPQAEFSKQDLDYFTSTVEPVLVQHCYGCHGNGKDKGGLNIYTREALLKGGESGAAVNFDDISASPLIEAINYASYEMPPSGKMPVERIEILTEWIRRGAPMVQRTDVQQAHHGEPEVNDETKAHWSFQRVHRPDVPKVAASDWVKTPVDAFILKRLADNGLVPSPRASRETLVRRLYYDLLGLPPTPQQVKAFVENDSPNAYRELVDELLDSPHYGEHWARYWLDVVRYAESNSFERDNPKPFVWRYRDYVIRSFNEDRPYDEFLIQQLAGDELENVTADSIIATGFYRLGAWDDEPADPMQARFDELDDIVTTTTQGFLGLTMNCCRCHNHKLDPIPTGDYYRLLAFFNNTERYGIRGDDTVYQKSVRSIATPEELTAFAEEKTQYEARVAELRTQLDEVENQIREQLVGGEKDDFQADSVRLRIIKKYVGKYLSQEEFDAYAQRRKEWTDLRNQPPKSADQALCITESGPNAPPTFIQVRGNPNVQGDEVQPGFPEVLGFEDPVITAAASGQSSGRRTALARWITSPENPLTARVMVNRVWQGHFGRGIVRSSNNFGLQGDAPTHPELLDWLASEFMENGWSVKQLHRTILLSNTYQMSSTSNTKSLEQDPENNLFWRFDPRRLRAEEIRDSILAVNGSLNLDSMFGPSIYPVIPAEVLAGQSRPGAGWGNSSPEDRNRRSVYIHIKRSLTVPLLASFDVADTDFTCPVRFATTQPTQALGMLNSTFLNEEAEAFSKFLKEQAGDKIDAQVAVALERVTQRKPTQQEIDWGLKLIGDLQSEHKQSPELALKNFCLLALNLNEFIYLD